MSQKKWKILMAAGGALMVGSFAVFRKFAPIRGESCPYCKGTDIYTLKSKGRQWGQACLGCDARYRRGLDGNVERLSEEDWAEAVSNAHVD